MDATFLFQIPHDLMYAAAHAVGHEITADTPGWVHPVFHLVLVWAPIALVALALWRLVSALRVHKRPASATPPLVPGFEPGVYAFALRWTRAELPLLLGLSFAALPVLYAALELPKLIVNRAIDAEGFPLSMGPWSFDQLEFLFVLCALYLVAVMTSGALKFAINVAKGRVGERVLRRLRLTIYRRWRAGAGGPRRGETIPLIAQEVEPIGGFAAEAIVLPVFQAGTFLTILAFMFVQDPVLGSAAVSLLPVQLVVIPRLQRRVNQLARARVAEMRTLGGELAGQSLRPEARIGLAPREGLADVCGGFRRIESIRRNLQREKFFMKSVSNFLASLTPFFFYAIGGWLVIEGRLTLGALVAVLAAYKDFSAPLRELLRHYQAVEDVRVRYQELLAHLDLSEVSRALPASHARDEVNTMEAAS